MHRADAALALGAEYTLEPALAADAISEWLERVAGQAGRDGAALPLEPGNTVHLHATDPGWAHPANGPSKPVTAGSPGRTSTARARSRCAAAPPS
ncbi:MDMPI C-terminal domain protein [Mycobacterium xenopi 4042]|uniref:MDMPI C-terminal domain protein n=1 Tax=Mycobacterium xenopi 4042 TaxID=1299334 RepID=X7ZBJ3_MYCXE|nr:MDMPI C-terminal domain protein [Mycobacterium xenopi 4042]